jgi:hypothetical protein
MRGVGRSLSDAVFLPGIRLIDVFDMRLHLHDKKQRGAAG